MMKTTLNRIKSDSPCSDGWAKLLKSLGKIEADDTEVTIRHIIDSNGVEDAIWALRAVDGHDREIRLFAAWCAEQSLHIFERYYPNDNRPRLAIQAARDYANGVIDTTASDAAMATASDAAMAAARATANDAASDAARAAAWAAESDAAWDAASDAAWAAERATESDAAMAAARAGQKTELCRICDCIENGIEPYPTT